ncbi:MAG: DNA primase [Patescibacteria group bacterium]|mgnify:CR=1 FL=1
MDNQVEEIKKKINIVDIVSEHVVLKKKGKNFVGLCPFHGEKTASFMVNEELQIYKCFGCFPAGQAVLVPGGIKAIEEVRKDDLVISGTGKKRRVLRTFRRSYRGLVVGLTTRMFAEEVVMTVDHKVLAVVGAPYTMSYKNLSKRVREYQHKTTSDYHNLMEKYFPIKKVSAGELKRGQCLLYPINDEVLDSERLDIAKYITRVLPPHGRKPKEINYEVRLEDDFLKLAGYYIAEGSNNRAYVRFSLGSHERAFANEIIEITRRLFGLNGKIHSRNVSEKKSGLEISVCHSFLANIFEELFGKGADNKRIPEAFMRLPVEKQKILVEAIKKGDGTTYLGSKSRNKHNAITTISQTLAMQLRDLLLRMGDFPSLQVEKEKVDKKGISHRMAYTVVWSEEATSRYNLVYKTREGYRYWMLPVRKIKEEVFQGEVFNLMIEEDHTYIPRGFVVGNCGAGGDVYKFLMETEGLDFPEALEKLADKAGVKLVKRVSEGHDSKRELIEVHDLAAEYYHYLLTKHPAGGTARQYLGERGIKEKLIETFSLGYALPEWDGLVEYLVNKKGYRPEVLTAAGLAVGNEKRLYDRFRGRIMFPLLDISGRVVGFSGRILPAAKEDEAKYINSPETEIYHKSKMLFGLTAARAEIKKKNRVVLVEGELDMISSFAAGVSETVAIKGSALTTEMIGTLSRLTNTFILALDADAAGEAAMKRSIEEAEKLELSIKMVEIIGGKDPDEIARNKPHEWVEMVERAAPVYEFFFNKAVGKWGTDSVEGVAKVVREVVPYLAKVENGVIREVWARKLAEKVGVDKARVWEEIEKIRSGRREKKVEISEKPSESMAKYRFDLQVVGLLLFSAEELREKIKKELVGLPIVGAAGKLVETILESGEALKTEQFIAALPQELRSLAEEAYLIGSEGEDGDKDVKRLVLEWARRVIRGERNRLTELIKKGEEAGDEALLANLSEKLVKLNTLEKKLVIS